MVLGHWLRHSLLDCRYCSHKIVIVDSSLKVLLTGSRTWEKRGPIEALMLGLKNAHFILGDCPTGLDAIALSVVIDNKLSAEVHTADWTIGLGGGPKRNTEMVAAGPHLAFAFKQQGESSGTEDCMRKCVQKGIPVYLITPVDINTPGMLQVAGRKGYRYNSATDLDLER